MKWVQILPPNATRVIELGCGDGTFGAAFKRIQPDCRYFGIDADTEAIRQAVRVLDRAAQAPYGKVDFSRYGVEQVDCMLCRAPYWQREDVKALLEQWRSILSEQGQIILEAAHDYPLQKIVPFIEMIGFGVVQQTPDCQYVRIFCGHPGRSMGLRVLTYDPVCENVRLCMPDSFMQTLPGVFVEETPLDVLRQERMAMDDSVLLFQRLSFVHWSTAASDIAYAAQSRQLIVHEFDDHPIYWEENYTATDYVEFRGVHVVQTTTPALADLFRAYNPHVLVFENMLTELPARRLASKQGAPVTIFYGALNRQADWAEIMPVLNEAIARYGTRLRFKVTADRAFFDALQTERKEFVGAAYNDGKFAPYELYMAALHESDIALLPLGDTEFNRMKSDLKFIEAAGNGAVVLASPTVYARTVRDGRTGFLYRSPREFAGLLAALIEDPILRYETATLAYQYVKENRMLAQHYEERAAAYRELAACWDELECERQQRIAQRGWA